MDEPRIYGTQEAADYLGMSKRVLQYHIYSQAHLEPDIVVGQQLGFYRKTLDAFKAEHLSSDYTLDEAATYLGVSRQRMRDHVFNRHTLRPTGRRRQANTFSRAALEAVRPLITTTARRSR